MRRFLKYFAMLFCLLPLLSVIYLSLVEKWQYPILLQNFTLRHWGLVFNGLKIGNSFLLSLFISSIISLIATVFGFWVSKAMMYDLRKTEWIKLAYLPYAIAPVILGAMLQHYFIRLGLNGTLAGVLLAQFLFIAPYSALLFSTFWNERIHQITFQGFTLGANENDVFKRILIPIARPWIILSLIQCFLISWFEFGMTRLIGVGKVKTLTVSIIQLLNEANPHLAAVAVCLMILPLVIILIFNRRWIERREIL